MRKEHEERSDDDAEKITTKSKTNPTPIFEEVLPRLDSQNCGITTCLQGKNAFLWGRYRETKRGQNDERKQQTNEKPWRSGIALRLKRPDVLSSRFHHYNAFVA